MTDLVTIAIPVYNRDRYFREALESALNQTTPARVMVVDNASPDVDFQAILQPYACERLTYHRNERNLGMIGNWNECIQQCRTPYLLILHDDDRLDTGYISALVQGHESEELSFGRVKFFDEAGKPIDKDPIGPLERYQDLGHWVLRNPVPVGAIFCVEAAKTLGMFNPALRYTPDFHLWFRLALRGRVRIMDAEAGSYREYDSTERATTHFEASGRIHAGRRIQWKRNNHLLRMTRERGAFTKAPPGGVVPFREVIAAAVYLNDYRLRYLVATAARSPSRTFLGRVIRPFIRVAGFPIAKVLGHLQRAVRRDDRK